MSHNDSRDGAATTSRSAGGGKLHHDLKEAIISGRMSQGERLLPIHEWASRYNITFSMARTAIQNLQRQGLVEMRVGCGTFVTGPGQNRSMGQTASEFVDKPAQLQACQTVGLQLGVNEHVFGQIAHALAETLHEHHVNTVNLPLPAPFNAEKFRLWLADPKAPELPAIVTRLAAPEIREFNAFIPASVRRIALSLMGIPILPMGWHSVSVDPQATGRIAVEYLLQRGHRRIGLATHPRVIHPQQPWNLRKGTTGNTCLIIAVGHVLRECGLHGALSIHYGVSHHYAEHGEITAGNPISESNLRSLEAWLAKPNRPTAVIGVDNRLYALKIAATRLGLRMPEDLELLGLGNTPYSQACGFNSISYNETEIAGQIADLLLTSDALLAKTERHLLVRPTLVIR